MGLRSERVGNLVRNTIGQIILTRMSDPRVDPARTSITHVEVTDDLLTAKVYISVIGTDGQQRRALTGLQRAAGHIQKLMMQQITLRHTPILEFVFDTGFKKGLKTIELLRQATEELNQRQAELDAKAETPQQDDL